MDIGDFEKIIPSRGGKKQPRLTLGASAYFRTNSTFNSLYKLEHKKAVDIRAKREPNKIIVAFRFLDENEAGSFAISHNPKNDTATFSGRGIFSHLNTNYKKVGTMSNLKVNIQNSNGEKLFIIEIPIDQ